ncbi:MAG: 2-oxo-4-hydroxy-4-carboxy-5-ureidoimidazoline decarboxylase, partial [Aestuariivirgaceae bacterium]
ARCLDCRAMIPLDVVNAMAHGDFVETFGDIAEHSPWVAETAAADRPFADRRAMVAAFAGSVQSAAPGAKLALLCAHPDLAGKAAMTDDSTREQAGAGLDALTPEEFERFTAMNDAYKTKFEFPFIFAVKGADKFQILEAFEERLENSREREFDTACAQVCRILRFRIEDRVAP